MLQLFYIVLVLLNKMVGNLNFFHSLSVFFSLDDGQIWSVRKIWPSKHLWILVRSHRLKAPSPFSLLLFGTELSTFYSPKEEHHWEIFQLTSFRVSDRVPKHIALISPSGRKQQPSWCCRNDREMNCECLHAICGCVGSLQMQRKREKSKKLLKLSCGGSLLLWESVLLNDNRRDVTRCTMCFRSLHLIAT